MSDVSWRTVVIGVGNPFRHDDGAGPAVIEALHARSADLFPDMVLTVADGEPTRLLDLWTGASLAVVIDAVDNAPSSPGQVHELVLDAVPPPAPAASSHGVGFGTAIELGRLLGRMPERLVIYAVTGADFTVGAGLSEPVKAAVDELADRVLRTCRRAR